MAIKISTSPTLSTLNVKERLIEDTDENYSSPLVNYVESNRIDGVDYTRLYTEVDTNLNVGDRVYIINGNYDTYDIIEINPYRKGTNGYVILEIDRCAITLDIEYTGETPWDEDDFDNYIKIYASHDDQRTAYEVLQNGYYPYKYTYGFRGNNNILFTESDNAFFVADPYNDVSDFANWTDVTTGFLSNSMPTLSGNDFTDNNGKVLVMDDFVYDGQEFRKGYVYKYENGSWVIDNNSRKSYLSKANFRDGRFAGGNWNDGVFGQLEKKIEWTGSTWNNGVFLNANWLNGVMGSKSDNITRQSYYAFLENGNIKQTTDFNNNSGFGYNFIDDSSFSEITINNANATNCTFGSYSATYSLMRRYLTATESNPDFGFDINLKNGRYVESLIEDALVSDGLFEFSTIENSNTTDGRFVDTDIDYSVAAGEYEGIGSIEVLGYERIISSEEFVFDNPYATASYIGTTSSLVVNHKFYISEENYLKIKAGSWINLNRLVTNNPDFLNFLDNSFYMGSDKNGNLYLADNYGERSNVLVQLNSKKQNEKIKTIPVNGEFPNFTEATRSNPRASLDIHVHFEANNIGYNDFELEQTFDMGSDLSGDDWTLTVGSSMGSTVSSGGFFTSSNVSYFGANSTSPTYSVEAEGDGASYSIYSPTGSGFDYMEYYWCSSVFMFNTNEPVIHVAGLTSSTWAPIDTITATDSSGPFDPGTDWFVQSFNISGDYEQIRLTVEFPSFSGPVTSVKIDDILISGSNSFVSSNISLDEWRNGTDVDINYRQKVTDFKDTKIQVANIDKTIFNGGNWKASKVNNVDYIIERGDPIYGTATDYGEYLSMTFSGGQLEIILNDFSNILYPGQIELDDVIAIDNISYVLGGTISKIDGLYSVATYSESPLTLVLDDLGTQSIAGSYSTGGEFISTFIVDGGSTYSITDLQPIFNSVHFEKIQNTKITNGFIKRELFKSNAILNENFVAQTDFDVRNFNRLKISEMLIDSSNDLTVESGFFIRNFIKDTEWTDGTIYRSVLKDMTVLNGVVAQSKWKSGTFSGGIFLDARKETISDPTNLSLQFSNQIALSEWDNGEFTDGEFFDAIWDNGNFRGGKFYNSIFAAGYWFDGEFGDRRYNNSDSKFGDGFYTRESKALGHPDPTWYNGVFTNGLFGIGEAGIPDELIDGTLTEKLTYLSTAVDLGTVSWHDGTFNDGTIQSFSQSASTIWYDGTFNNGDVIGYVHWLDGTFNQGKFRSSWGDGYGTQSDDYAWVGGIFNGGRFGDSNGEINVALGTDLYPLGYGLNITESYSNPSWLNGRFNDGFFYGKVWNDGVLTGGRFIGNSQSTWTPSIYERWEFDAGTISQANTYLFDGNLGEWTSIPNTIPDANVPVTGNLIIQQVSSFEEFSGTAFGTASWSTSNPYSILFGTTYSGVDFFAAPGQVEDVPTSQLISPQIDERIESIEMVYRGGFEAQGVTVSWIFEITADGVDDNGDPFTIDLIPATATYPYFPQGPLDEQEISGIIKIDIPDSIGYIPSSSKYTFKPYARMISVGSTSSVEASSIELFIDDLKFNIADHNRYANLPDQFVMDYSEDSEVNHFGMWRDGLVISDNTVAVAKSNFIKLSQLESVRRFKGETSPNIFFENALWVNGTFSAFGQIDNCVWLNGSFKNGRFLNSSFNPYVPRWDFFEPGGTTYSSTNKGKYSYELSDDCIWKSGYLDNSEFSISEWSGGVFNSGDMIGGYFKDGVANYMNAYNVVWENGRWRNGNWYGSNFDKNEVFDQREDSSGNVFFTTYIGRVMDILTTSAKRLGNQSGNNELFLWNAFDETSGTNPYASSLPYQYWNGTTHSSSILNNNDFILFGSMSETTTISDGSTYSLARNRSFGLIFNNISSGYDTGAELYWTSVQDELLGLTLSNGARINSKWGNGAFISGRWENGVWNSGVRVDESFDTNSVLVYMDDVTNFFQVSPDRWQIEIKGFDSIDSFSLGDYISIGNIVGITVNGTRKLLKDSYQIISINKTDITLSVIVKTPFPLRSIERDSDNHRILITKNVWENGKFHNGKFDGVWNSGRVEGYPQITQFENTYWIDGIFDGGKFSSTQLLDTFGQTYSNGLIQNAYIDAKGIFETDRSYLTWIDVNFDLSWEDSRSTAIWGVPVSQPAQLALPIETTKDVLSSRFKLYLGPEIFSGVQSTLNRKEVTLSLGDKFNYYDQLITDDILGYQPGQNLGDNGWQFSTTYTNGSPFQAFSTYLPLTQSKFLGYTYLTGDAADAIVIDTTLDPSYEVDYHPDYSTSNGTFSWADQDLKYNIGNTDLSNIDRQRYWEVSFTLTQHDWGDITPYPGLGSTPPMVEGQTWKAYIWNAQPEDTLVTTVTSTATQPIISVSGATGISARINDITFTEVDSIPFYDYWSSVSNIDRNAKIPIESNALQFEQSETDAFFIDNKSNTNTK